MKYVKSLPEILHIHFHLVARENQSITRRTRRSKCADSSKFSAPSILLMEFLFQKLERREPDVETRIRQQFTTEIERFQREITQLKEQVNYFHFSLSR